MDILFLGGIGMFFGITWLLVEGVSIL